MTKQRQRAGNPLAAPSQQQPSASTISARKFSVQSEIQKLQDELNAFNERIAELENEGHRSRAMDVLKANAMDFASRIDELRSLLAESAKADAKEAKL
jgi:hypothetical protein